ncbi:MAG: DUF4278 domain-containing protein [Cyanobium sp.]
MTTPLRYRGLPYEKSSHEQPSTRPVEHTYRGRRYQAALLHEAATADTKAVLCYRGLLYVSHRGLLSAQG